MLYCVLLINTYWLLILLITWRCMCVWVCVYIWYIHRFIWCWTCASLWDNFSAETDLSVSNLMPGTRNCCAWCACGLGSRSYCGSGEGKEKAAWYHKRSRVHLCVFRDFLDIHSYQCHIYHWLDDPKWPMYFGLKPWPANIMQHL